MDEGSAYNILYNLDNITSPLDISISNQGPSSGPSNVSDTIIVTNQVVPLTVADDLECLLRSWNLLPLLPVLQSKF